MAEHIDDATARFLGGVMPVIVGPAPWPNKVPAVAKAASYSPMAIPTPITVHPRYHAVRFGAVASSV